MLNIMPEVILIETVVLVVISIVAVIAVMLYRKETRLRQRLLESAAQAALRKEKEKSHNILHRAIQKAQSLLGIAELESIKVVADSKVTTRKMEEKYESELSQVTQGLKDSLQRQADQAQTEFTNFLSALKAGSEQAQKQSEEFTKQKVNEIFERFETNLASFLTSTEQKSVAAIELELKASKQLIDTYKTQQLALIDENIISMLERTLSLVLSKKLTLKDQLDLVYEALEKAKVEKFIIWTPRSY